VTRFESSRGSGLATRVALFSVCVVIAALMVGVSGGPGFVSSPGSAPSTESVHSSPSVPDGHVTTNSVRARLLPTGMRAIAGSLAAIALIGRTARPRRLRHVRLVLDDVGDRWRALLIGAPPALPF